MKKRIIITGASRGIGRELARQLAEEGHELFLVSRDRERLSVLREEISGAQEDTRINLATADLSLLHDVHRVCREISEHWQDADALVINHAAIFPELTRTSEGLESNLALNFLSYAGLMIGLAPLVQASSGGRIVNVVAEAHRLAAIDIETFPDAFNTAEEYNSVDAYCRAKLAVIMFACELSGRDTAQGVDIFCVHPGSMYTDALQLMRREYTRLTGSSEFPEATSVQDGIGPLLALTNNAKHTGRGWAYFVKDKRVEPSDEALSLEKRRKLFEVTVQLLDQSEADKA